MKPTDLLLWMFENNRSDLCGGTTSRIHKVLSLLLTAMTEIVLLRRGMSFTGCWTR